MKTNLVRWSTTFIVLALMGMLVVSGVASAQETPIAPEATLEITAEITAEVTPEATLEITEVVTPEVVLPVATLAPENAPIIVIPAQIDVSALNVSLVASDIAPVLGNTFTVDLNVSNPLSIGLESLALQCVLEKNWFIVEPLVIEAVLTVVDGQPTPTPTPPIFGENPFVVPFTVDPNTNTASFSITQTVGAPAFESGKIVSFNLRAVEAGAFNLVCATIVVDSNGLTQGVATSPLAITVRASADEPIVIGSAPIVIEATPLPAEPTAIILAEQPTATPTVVAPVDTTVVEAPTAAPILATPTLGAPVVVATVPPNPGTITGRVLATGDITITLSTDAGVVAIVNTAPDGNFIFLNVLPGFYTITADAKGHLPAQGGVGLMPANTVNMNIVELVAGDLNNDNIAVDANDMALLNVTYDSTGGALLAELDLDGNGSIGLGDLNILAENLGKVGPTLWQ